MIKSAEITISVKFFYSQDNIFQHFLFLKKRDAKLCSDPRYLIHDKLEEKIHEQGLHTLYGLEFIDRVDKEDRIIISYTKPELKLNLKSYFFVLAAFMPETTGCAFCKFKQENKDGTIFCPIIKKTFVEEYKRCKWFRQKDGLFKT